MANANQCQAAKKFADEWINRDGYERGETQPFWITLLSKVFGVKEPGTDNGECKQLVLVFAEIGEKKCRVISGYYSTQFLCEFLNIISI